VMSGEPTSLVSPPRAKGAGSTPSSSTGKLRHSITSSCSSLRSLASGRVWTAIYRGVHSSDFMFQALKDSRQPQENMHDVYCSGCGRLTACRSRNNAEGGAPDIFLAGVRLALFKILLLFDSLPSVSTALAIRHLPRQIQMSNRTEILR
jgi:hypothetical protein